MLAWSRSRAAAPVLRRSGSGRLVFVGADGADGGQFTVNPMCLTDEEADYVVERISDHLT